MLFKILITIIAFASMELVAWFTHKYIMHGILWTLHKDHHKKESKGFFEHNDFFFLIFALPGFFSMLTGYRDNFSLLFFAGLGITAYGITYFLVHDIFIHQRFRLFRSTQNRYLKTIRRAHKIHHTHIEKENGECFGMLWFPTKFLKNKAG